jgi:hypothetical protein
MVGEHLSGRARRTIARSIGRGSWVRPVAAGVVRTRLRGMIKEFPVLSAGPTPHVPLEQRKLTIDTRHECAAAWSWRAFELPAENLTTDIHCVTVVEARHDVGRRVARHAAGGRGRSRCRCQSRRVAEPIQLLAGGSGIVPLMSMIRSRLATQSAAPFRLLYSVRSPDRVWYRDELQTLVADGIGVTLAYRVPLRNRTFHVHRLPVASSSSRGRVSDSMSRKESIAGTDARRL